MTKRGLITAICTANPDISKKVVEEAVNLFFEMIAFYLAHHQRVELRGFGAFSIRTRPSYQAHNPQTGEKIAVPEKSVPFFKASQLLRDHLKKPEKEKEAKKGKFFSFMYRDAPKLKRS